MADLITSLNIPDPDGFYARLIAAHDGLTEDESEALNACLILLLANHIGDLTVLDQALKAASGVASGKVDDEGPTQGR